MTVRFLLHCPWKTCFTQRRYVSSAHICCCRCCCFSCNECDIRDISALFPRFFPCVHFIHCARPVRVFVCAMCKQQNHNLKYTIMLVECTCNMRISIRPSICIIYFYILYMEYINSFLFRALFEHGLHPHRLCARCWWWSFAQKVQFMQKL